MVMVGQHNIREYPGKVKVHALLQLGWLRTAVQQDYNIYFRDGLIPSHPLQLVRVRDWLLSSTARWCRRGWECVWRLVRSGCHDSQDRVNRNCRQLHTEAGLSITISRRMAYWNLSRLPKVELSCGTFAPVVPWTRA